MVINHALFMALEGEFYLLIRNGRNDFQSIIVNLLILINYFQIKKYT